MDETVSLGIFDFLEPMIEFLVAFQKVLIVGDNKNEANQACTFLLMYTFLLTETSMKTC
jgi:EamA domain-containing membrane protein RarD